METYRKGNRIIEFEEEGVVFTFPPDLDYVFVKRLEIEEREGDGEFNPNRYVLNVLMFTKEEIDEDILKFRQKLKLLVKFKQTDLDYVTGLDRDLEYPVLGIFDGERWHKLVSTQDKVYFEKYPKPVNDWLGYAKVELDAWEDPLISWGP